jgi:biopolymer transport protein ExbD
MNFKRDSSGDENEPALNVTPLMDVMFLLVIFFAVSTTFRVYPGISINLPSAGSEQIKEEDKSITVVLTDEGDIFLEGKKVSLGHMSKVLQERLTTNPALMFVLQADEQARHGKVVGLMDAAKQAGISRLAIATRQKKGQPGPSPARDAPEEEK